MAMISNLQDFNMQLQDREVMQPKQQETNIKYIPNIMREQRENFKEIIGVLDLMERKGMITINRPEVIEYVEERNSAKEFFIGAGILFAIIKIGLLVL